MTSSLQNFTYFQAILEAVDAIRKMANLPSNHQVQAISLLTEYGQEVKEILATTRRINEDPSEENTKALLQLAIRLDDEARKEERQHNSEKPADKFMAMMANDLPSESEEKPIVITQSQTM